MNNNIIFNKIAKAFALICCLATYIFSVGIFTSLLLWDFQTTMDPNITLLQLLPFCWTVRHYGTKRNAKEADLSDKSKSNSPESDSEGDQDKDPESNSESKGLGTKDDPLNPAGWSDEGIIKELKDLNDEDREKRIDFYRRLIQEDHGEAYIENEEDRIKENYIYSFKKAKLNEIESELKTEQTSYYNRGCETPPLKERADVEIAVREWLNNSNGGGNGGGNSPGGMGPGTPPSGTSDGGSGGEVGSGTANSRSLGSPLDYVIELESTRSIYDPESFSFDELE